MARGSKRIESGDAADQTIAAQLDALYAKLPKLDCKARCWESCGPVLMAPAERERIRREGGVDIPTYPPQLHGQLMTCPALKSHRCTVHPVRPMMCRLWGIADWMRCPHGCKPEGGWMSKREATWFFLQTYLIAGWPVEQADQRLTPGQIVEQLKQLDAEFELDPPERVEPGPAPAASREKHRPSFLRRGRRSG